MPRLTEVLRPKLEPKAREFSAHKAHARKPTVRTPETRNPEARIEGPQK
jgi:hypothetical protein